MSREPQEAPEEAPSQDLLTLSRDYEPPRSYESFWPSVGGASTGLRRDVDGANIGLRRRPQKLLSKLKSYYLSILVFGNLDADTPSRPGPEVHRRRRERLPTKLRS